MRQPSNNQKVQSLVERLGTMLKEVDALEVRGQQASKMRSRARSFIEEAATALEEM